MIDLEATIYGNVKAALDIALGEDKYKMASTVTGEPAKKFPYITVMEMDNATYARTRTGSSAEEHARLTYEVNVYSNLTSGRKEQCRKIAEAIDEAMLSMGFRRMSLHPVPNYMDATIYRMTGRYAVIAGKDGKLYYA